MTGNGEGRAGSVLRIDIEDDEIDFDYNFCEYRGEPFTGELAEYGSEGQLLELKTYTDGLPDGPSVAWYPDGTLKHESQVRRGYVVGLCREYHPNGTLAVEKIFGDDSEVIERRTWNEQGYPTSG